MELLLHTTFLKKLNKFVPFRTTVIFSVHMIFLRTILNSRRKYYSPFIIISRIFDLDKYIHCKLLKKMVISNRIHYYMFRHDSLLKYKSCFRARLLN